MTALCSFPKLLPIYRLQSKDLPKRLEIQRSGFLHSCHICWVHHPHPIDEGLGIVDPMAQPVLLLVSGIADFFSSRFCRAEQHINQPLFSSRFEVLMTNEVRPQPDILFPAF